MSTDLICPSCDSEYEGAPCICEGDSGQVDENVGAPANDDWTWKRLSKEAISLIVLIILFVPIRVTRWLDNQFDKIEHFFWKW